MSFTRVWASGLAFNAPPGSANLTQLDINVSKAIDGSAIGTYAPTGVITIGGSGLSVTGAFNASAANNITFGGTLTGSSGCTVNFSGTHTLAGTTAISGTLNANGTTNLAGVNTISGPTTHSGALTYSNANGIAMTGTQPAYNANPGANKVHATNTCKAWVTFTNVSSVVTIHDGFNILGVSVTGTTLVVQFVEPMANLFYCVMANDWGNEAVFYPVANGGHGLLSVVLQPKDASGVNIDPVITTNRVMVMVFGRQ